MEFTSLRRGMGLYTKDSIDRVKDAIDMVELVGPRSDLRRSGGGWMGPCPFHDERTPSFSVDAQHKLYHCFGCGASGDAIKFVEETEAVDFKTALELLAERYGVELKREQEDPEAERRRRRRERLLQIVERAAAFYERYLWESSEAADARAYLERRGLGEEVLRQFRVGWSPEGWERLVSAALRDGFNAEELLAAGVAQRGRQGLHDRFRSRIMFPLADSRGRVLGFGARALREDQRPKYLNTSENELYRKGRQLFGIDRARAAAAKAGRVVAVEGYTDVLALHQAGISEAVAVMGTALTQEQLAELGRAARTVYLALDADRSGQEAMLRAASAAEERGMELLVVDLPAGNDPAELVAHNGADAFGALLKRAVLAPEFAVRRELARADLSTGRGRDQALAAVRPLIQELPERSEARGELVRYVADRLETPLENLLIALSSPSRSHDTHAPGPIRSAEPNAGDPARPALDADARRERAFLRLCLAGDGGRELARLEPDHFTSAPLRQVRDHLLTHWEDPLGDLPQDDERLAALVKDVAIGADDEYVSSSALKVAFLQLELRRVERRLQRAQREGDLDAQPKLARERQGLREQIGELMGLTQ